jgi:hypothetical protein
MNNLATIDEVVALAASRIPKSTEEDWNIFKYWAYIAEEKIGPSDWVIKAEDITEQKDGTFCKPSDHVRTIDLAFFSGGKEVKYRFDNGKQKIHSSDAFSSNILHAYEDNSFIHTGNGEVDCMTIKYYSCPIDDDGNPLIPRWHIDAIAVYIEYNWELAGNFIAKAGHLYNRWLWAAKNARGKNKMPSVAKANDIVSDWMSMVAGNINKYKNK